MYGAGQMVCEMITGLLFVGNVYCERRANGMQLYGLTLPRMSVCAVGAQNGHTGAMATGARAPNGRRCGSE